MAPAPRLSGVNKLSTRSCCTLICFSKVERFKIPLTRTSLVLGGLHKTIFQNVFSTCYLLSVIKVIISIYLCSEVYRLANEGIEPKEFQVCFTLFKVKAGSADIFQIT